MYINLFYKLMSHSQWTNWSWKDIGYFRSQFSWKCLQIYHKVFTGKKSKDFGIFIIIIENLWVIATCHTPKETRVFLQGKKIGWEGEIQQKDLKDSARWKYLFLPREVLNYLKVHANLCNFILFSYTRSVNNLHTVNMPSGLQKGLEVASASSSWKGTLDIASWTREIMFQKNETSLQPCPANNLLTVGWTETMIRTNQKLIKVWLMDYSAKCQDMNFQDAELLKNSQTPPEIAF